MSKVILSFDVGVVNLSYCLLTKSDNNWNIIEWNNIDLTNRNELLCNYIDSKSNSLCNKKANFTNIVNNLTNHYCNKCSKNVNISVTDFENYYINFKQSTEITCCYNVCSKKACYNKDDNHYCTLHAKQIYKNYSKNIELKPFKLKNSSTINFDDIKYKLMMELEKQTQLLNADYVVIENQPSMKNPRMKSIASTIYDYYLIRGIIDKTNNNSNITQVKFISPSNKLKLANSSDIEKLDKSKTSATENYKLTKSLGIKYCLELISHLPEWITFFNNNKKKDDLADSFLQGIYFYNLISSK